MESRNSNIINFNMSFDIILIVQSAQDTKCHRIVNSISRLLMPWVKMHLLSWRKLKVRFNKDLGLDLRSGKFCGLTNTKIS